MKLACLSRLLVVTLTTKHLCSQKDVLRKLGNPTPQNTLYMTVKILLERTAPVLIDGLAIGSLIKLVSSAITTSSKDEFSDMPRAVESGMKLLLVCVAENLDL